MKNLLLLAVISVSLFACTSSATQKEKANIALVAKYVEAVESMDFEAMEKFLSDDYIGMGPSYGDTITKAEAVENWKANVADLYEKIKYHRSRLVAITIPEGDNKGEWVANWAELTITYKNDLGEATIWANTNYLIENGMIARSITFYNEADALRQLGYKMVPAGE